MRACAEHIEHNLIGPWALGERYSVADGYLYTIASWLEADGVDTSTLPRLLAHRTRMNARQAVQRALAEAG
jgi:glutathione S-transferase